MHGPGDKFDTPSVQGVLVLYLQQSLLIVGNGAHKLFPLKHYFGKRGAQFLVLNTRVLVFGSDADSGQKLMRRPGVLPTGVETSRLDAVSCRSQFPFS